MPCQTRNRRPYILNLLVYGSGLRVPGGSGPWGPQDVADLCELTASTETIKPQPSILRVPGGSGPWGSVTSSLPQLRHSFTKSTRSLHRSEPRKPASERRFGCSLSCRGGLIKSLGGTWRVSPVGARSPWCTTWCSTLAISVQRFGFRVSGQRWCSALGIRVQRFGMRDSGFGCTVQDFVCRVSCVVFRVSDLQFRVLCFSFRFPIVFRVTGCGSRVSGLGFGVSGVGFRLSCLVSGFGI